MTTTLTQTTEPTARRTPRWSVGGRFLEALAARDFDSLASCLDPDVVLRAAVPTRFLELNGRDDVIGRFRTWFASATDFEMIDATVGEIAHLLQASWRIRLRPAPSGVEGWHVLQQQTFLRIGDTIESIHLVCSGFLPEVQS